MARLSSTRISYTATLALLFIVVLITLNFPDLIFSQAWLPIAAVGAAILLMISARKLGRILMRNEGYDSIWEFRWFFLGFWVLMLIGAIIFAAMAPISSNIMWAVFMLLIVAANIGGIVIHHKTRSKLVKNIKKDELFQ